MDQIAWLAAVGTGLVLAAMVALAARRSFMARDRLRLAQVVERVGVDVTAMGKAGVCVELAEAVENCRRCGVSQKCEAWLEAGQKTGFEAFCPNAALIRKIGAVEAA